MEIEGTQIFEKEEYKPPVAVSVLTNIKSSTIMVLEVAADACDAGPALLAKQYLAWSKKDLKLRCQPTQGNKKILLETLKDAMNRKLVRYLTSEEDK